MMWGKTIIFFLVLPVFFLSCDDKYQSSVSYFGGEIVNPRNRYVLLYKNDRLIDSAVLDSTNRFLIRLDNVAEGIYHFEHEPEYQYVYIEKGDSILVRLNTLDFDESTVFTGVGADKNNFLIDMFLFNEDEEQLVYTYYQLERKDFEKKMDSLLAMKTAQYENLIANYDLSENAIHIAKASIDYAHYIHREIYPYMYKSHNRLQRIPVLSNDFYAYRKTLNINDYRLSHFRPYFNYVMMTLNNLSYHDCMKNCVEKESSEKTPHYHMHKLRIIDSLITDSVLRDNLYRSTAYTYFLEDHNPMNNLAFLETFKALYGENKYLDEITGLYRATRNLYPGKPLPDIALVNAKDEEIDIKNVLSTPSYQVFYFWSVYQRNHLKNIRSKIKKLKAEYPSYAFIGINVDDARDRKTWLKYIKAYHLDTNMQFRAEQAKMMREKLVINSLNKIILTTADGIIIDAFADIYDHAIEDSLRYAQNMIW